MHTTVKHLFDKMEAHRVNLFKDLDKHAPEMMNKKPESDKWSVVQVMNHLADAEQTSVDYLRKKMTSEGPLPTSGLKATYRYLLLRLAFILPIKFKAPKFAGSPSNDMSYEETKAKWDGVRQSLKHLLSEMTDEQVKAEIFKHPRVGKMNLLQALKFMQAHVDRHTQQIFNTLKQIDAQ